MESFGIQLTAPIVSCSFTNLNLFLVNTTSFKSKSLGRMVALLANEQGRICAGFEQDKSRTLRVYLGVGVEDRVYVSGATRTLLETGRLS